MSRFINRVGLMFVIDEADRAQVEVTGEFDAQLSRKVLNALADVGYCYNPEFSGEDTDSAVFEIAAKAQESLTGEFDAKVCRAIARRLTAEGVRLSPYF